MKHINQAVSVVGEIIPMKHGWNNPRNFTGITINNTDEEEVLKL